MIGVEGPPSPCLDQLRNLEVRAGILVLALDSCIWSALWILGQAEWQCYAHIANHSSFLPCIHDVPASGP